MPGLNFSHPRMYADDTSITYAGKDLNEIDDYLNKDLKSVNTWLSSNKLTLYLSKTEFLVKTSRQRRVYFDLLTKTAAYVYTSKIISISKSPRIYNAATITK